jgi:hypothetical protein
METDDTSAAGAAELFTIRIHYEITQDNFDGSPWPPDGADLWVVVRRGRVGVAWDLDSPDTPAGFTKWRRIALKT